MNIKYRNLNLKIFNCKKILNKTNNEIYKKELKSNICIMKRGY